MNFKIATLFEQVTPPVTIQKDSYEIDFDSDTSEDIATIISEILEEAEELNHEFELTDVSWEEGSRDMYEPKNGHYTVPDGDYTLEDWTLEAPESITLVLPFLGSPKKELMPKYITPTFNVETSDGGSATMTCKLPITAVNLNTEKSIIAITLGQSELEQIIEAKLPEPDGEPDDYYDDRY